MKTNAHLLQNENKNNYYSSLNTPYMLSMIANSSYFHLLAFVIKLQPIWHPSELECVFTFWWRQYEISYFFFSSWGLLGI